MIMIFFLFLAAIVSFGQRSIISLSFTGITNEQYVQLSRVEIRNLNTNCDTTIYWPDTVLAINSLGINDLHSSTSELQVFQNVPNPVLEDTKIWVYLPDNEDISIYVSLLNGNKLNLFNQKLQRGFHSFLFTPGGSELYFFTVCNKGMKKSIKIASSMERSLSKCTLAYIGLDKEPFAVNLVKGSGGFTFSVGDTLRFIGYYDTLTYAFQDAPTSSKLYTINFPISGISCPGLLAVTYMGQTYNTVKIGTQCWLRENLNAGIKINGTQEQENNGVIEKYCYDNDLTNCNTFGGLYQWHEIMQYTSTPGSQGICPQNWHLPTSDEWDILTDFLGGYIAGGKMKTTGTIEAGTGLWNAPNIGATNESGFSALPSGDRYRVDGLFYNLGTYCAWWSSSESYPEFAWMRYINNDDEGIRYWGWFMNEGLSVRCVYDFNILN